MELSVKQMFALFNPHIAPLSFAGALVSLFAGARDCAAFNLAVGCTERKLNVSAVLPRMSDDARATLRYGNFCGDDVRKLLVFISQVAALQLTVLRRAFYPLRKMAPVAGCGHGTHAGMRARREDVRRIRDQRGARGVHGGKAASGPRLDDQ